MPLEVKAQAFVDQMAAQTAAADPPPPPLDQIPPNVVRETFNAFAETLDYPGEPVANVEEREIPGEVRHLRDCNCESKGGAPLRAYGMASNSNTSSSRTVNGRN